MQRIGANGMSSFAPWDIWWADVKFEDSDEVKRRPVIILETGAVFALSAKVTSHEARNQWGEYEIVKWQTAGLQKPSTVRLTQLFEIDYKAFKSKIGRLHAYDIANIQKQL